MAARNTSASISSACASKSPCAVSKDIRQGFINLVRQTKKDITAILFHGVSLSLRGAGRLDTRLSHIVITQFPALLLLKAHRR
jgi:hypothetical protein